MKSFDAGSSRRATWPASASLRLLTVNEIGKSFLYKSLLEMCVVDGVL